jgi:hypothetical protein
MPGIKYTEGHTEWIIVREIRTRVLMLQVIVSWRTGYSIRGHQLREGVRRRKIKEEVETKTRREGVGETQKRILINS